MATDTILFYEDYEQERPRRFSIPARTDYMGYLVGMWQFHQDAPFPDIPDSIDAEVQAFVNHGRWVWQCDVCNSAYPVSNQVRHGLCVICGDSWIAIALPDDLSIINETLISMPGHRYNAPLRNWRPDWDADLLSKRAQKARERLESGKGSLVSLSIRATRTWLVGEILTATNMNTYVSGTDDDLAGRNGPVEFENSIEVNDGAGRFIKAPTSSAPASPRNGMLHYLSSVNRLRLYANAAWRNLAELADVSFDRLNTNGQIGNSATQLVRGDHSHDGTAGDGEPIPSGGLEANSVRLQEIAHGTANHVLGYDGAGAPAVVRANSIQYAAFGATRPNGERPGDTFIYTHGFASLDPTKGFTGLASGTYLDIALTSTRIYLLVDSNPDSIRVYGYDGARHSSEEWSLGDNSIRNITITNNRLYALRNSNSGTREIRAWDLSGNRQSSDDVSLGSINAFGLGSSGNRLYIINRSSNPRRMEAWTFAGVEQSSERIEDNAIMNVMDDVVRIGNLFYFLDSDGHDIRVFDENGIRHTRFDVVNFMTTLTQRGIDHINGTGYFVDDTNEAILAMSDGIASVSEWNGAQWIDRAI